MPLSQIKGDETSLNRSWQMQLETQESDDLRENKRTTELETKQV